MSKNIVILCDGTSNEIGGDRTNVLRLYGALERNARQHVFYDPGVGTFGMTGMLKRVRSWIKIRAGLAFGVGIDDNVLEAYRFLVEVYEPGDRIFAFGFSRGAYTVRLLTGFIRMVGLISSDQLNLLGYAYRAYKRLDAGGGFGGEIRHYQKVLQARQIRIHFVGLWDTVSSVFEPRPTGFGLQLKQQPFTNQNDRIEIVRHAVAIDERRSMFRPSLWKPDQQYDYWSEAAQAFQKKPQDFQEVWFAGCHGDVGGGNPEKDSGLAKVALEWLFEEACAHGVEPNPDSAPMLVLGIGNPEYVAPDPLGPINESLKGFFWRFVEFIPRRFSKTSTRKWPRLGPYYIPLGEPRKIDANAQIHVSVQKRIAAGGYNPPNLPNNPTFVPRRPESVFALAPPSA
ncbi:DUF2235 domain-containing protein [Neorhizobium galegae]|uniref:DUF2235 domain-containing protein n=1 Tax=Neorhizobium galegae TaxID=399 RepID=UPI0021070B86|nr:DUF2235 domain-containing protein [Neorhizobium galegae]MCQ1850831.1 DUF2235 domain-containing protein [Neorhizobium galegae]